jgi:hypothetical protein
MVLSLAVVLGVVGLTLLMTLRDEPDDPVRVVDTTPVVVAAAANAPFQAVVPAGLGEQWRATSARVSPPDTDPFEWHIGYVTPSISYAKAGQSTQPSADYLDAERAGSTRAGEQRVGGTVWVRYEREDGQRRSLVRVSGPVTTLVSGTGTYDELATLAGSLRPAGAVAAASRPTPAPS